MLVNTLTNINWWNLIVKCYQKLFYVKLFINNNTYNVNDQCKYLKHCEYRLDEEIRDWFCMFFTSLCESDDSTNKITQKLIDFNY